MVSTENVGLAIGLTFLAGFTTTIGALVAFCINQEMTQILPIALAFSAGVMIYISFVEILGESTASFEEALEGNKNAELLAHVYGSLTFFCGILLGYLIDYVVHKIGYDESFANFSKFKNDKNNVVYDKIKTNDVKSSENLANVSQISINKEEIEVQSVGLKDDDSNNDNQIQNGIAEDDIIPLKSENEPNQIQIVALKDDDKHNEKDKEKDNSNLKSMSNMAITPVPGSSAALIASQSVIDDVQKSNTKDKENDKHLIHVSIITALAIALHNFPEGLITFVSTLVDPKFGFSIAVAVAFHNIPEGVSVALPIYFATGSKWKGIFWAFLSGLSEPLGGLIGYAIIHNMFGSNVFGVLFGVTAGIMVYISFKELLPTARSKDIDDKYCSILVFCGFLFMDISLILFDI